MRPLRRCNYPIVATIVLRSGLRTGVRARRDAKLDVFYRKSVGFAEIGIPTEDSDGLFLLK